jgi:hypothetical protein
VACAHRHIFGRGRPILNGCAPTETFLVDGLEGEDMTMKVLVCVLVTAALFAGGASAGPKSNKFTSNNENNCKKMVYVKHVKKDAFQAELDKCLDNPSTYQ